MQYAYIVIFLLGKLYVFEILMFMQEAWNNKKNRQVFRRQMCMEMLQLGHSVQCGVKHVDHTTVA
jgi:hypothetical protein